MFSRLWQAACSLRQLFSCPVFQCTPTDLLLRSCASCVMADNRSKLIRSNIFAPEPQVNSLLPFSLPIHRSAALTLSALERTLTSNDQRIARQRDVLLRWLKRPSNMSGSTYPKQDCPRSYRRRAACYARSQESDGVGASSGLL